MTETNIRDLLQTHHWREVLSEPRVINCRAVSIYLYMWYTGRMDEFASIAVKSSANYEIKSVAGGGSNR